MIRTVRARSWIAAPRDHDLGAEFYRSLLSGVEVVHLEPEQDAIAIRFVITISDGPMVVVLLEAMQLQDDPLTINKPLILRPAMTAGATEELLVPATARFHIRDDDEGLRAQRISSRA